MNKTRLEAFSDGVLAIIITIMVLELKIPESTSWEVLHHLVPIFISYVLSFVFVGIYWGNHHHLLHTARRVTPGIIWANMHLLFWLSLVPFATGWMGVNKFGRIPVAVYGSVLIMCGLAYSFLSKAVHNTHEGDTQFANAFVKNKTKEQISTLLYCSSVPVALFIHPMISVVFFAIVSVMWIIPSREIEEALNKK